MSVTVAIGDVHGCIDQLNELLSKIESRYASGKVVFLGDYVDRGPDSRAAIQRIIDGPPKGWEWVPLKGNHEDMMVVCLEGLADMPWWLGNGGSATIASYGGEVTEGHYEWALNLAEKHEDEHRIFVHAGVDETIPYSDQVSGDLLWKRFPEHWSGQYWGKHLVHGHTPGPNNPVTVGNRTNVDSACVFGWKLSAVVFDDSTPGPPIDVISVKGWSE